MPGHIFVGPGDFSSWVAAVVLLVVGLGGGWALSVNDFLSSSGDGLIDNLLGSLSWDVFVDNSLLNSLDSWLGNVFSPVFVSVGSASLNSSFNSAFNSAFSFEGLVGVVDNLSLNRNVFISDLFLGNLDIFDLLLRNILRDVLSEIFNGIVVGDSDLTRNSLDLSFLLVLNSLDLLGDSLHLGLVLVFKDLLLEWNVFDSALSLDHLFAGVDGGADNLFPTGSHSGFNSFSVAALDWDSSSDSFDSLSSISGSFSVGIARLGDGGGDVVGVGGGDVLSGLVVVPVAVVVVADGLSCLSVDKLTG